MTWLKTHFQWFLLAAILLGFLAGPIMAGATRLINLCVGLIIFVGFVVRPDLPRGDSWGRLLRIWCLQKVAIPLGLFLLVDQVYPPVAIAVLLVSLLPAAGVSPALATLAGGHTGLSLRLLVFESFLACISIPAVLYLASWGDAQIDPLDIFAYLAGILVAPIVLAEILRAWTKSHEAEAMRAKSSLASVLLIILMVFVIAGDVSPLLLQDLTLSAGLLAFAFALAPVNVVIGVLTSGREQAAEAISYGMKNMFVNIGLGMGVASAYLGEIGMLVVLAYVIPINSLPKFAGILSVRLFQWKNIRS